MALAIVVDIDDGFHINPDPAQVVVVGDFEPYPTDVRILEAAGGLTLEAVRFPKPHPIQADYADGDLMVFEGRTVFYLPIKVGEEVDPGPQRLKLEVEYQACDEYTCFIPKTVVMEASLPIVDAGQPVNSLNSTLFKGYSETGAASEASGVRFDLFGWTFSIDTSSGGGLILLLIVAAFGGGLLNLTPCVLPVIPIKIIGLAQASGESDAASRAWGFDVAGCGRFLAGAGYNDCRHQWIYCHQSAVSVSGVYDPRRHNHRRHGRWHVRALLHPVAAGGLPVQPRSGQPRWVVRVRHYDGPCFPRPARRPLWERPRRGRPRNIPQPRC